MISLISWCVYGLIVGSIAKAIVLKNVTVSIWTTIFLGIVGSYVGGLINYLVLGSEDVTPSGMVLGIIGAVTSVVIYQKLTSKNTPPSA